MHSPTGLFRRFRSAWRALCAAEGSPESRIASLEMDLQERDQKIARLRREFDLQSRQSGQAVADAAAGELERLARRAAPLLSQLSTLQAMADAGREVRPHDLLKLAGKIRQLFVDAGLEPLGRCGEVSPFDTRIHQRLSGGDVREGDPVKVRFEGYRFHDTVVTKAMVSRQEESLESPTAAPQETERDAAEE
jgi:molecular chaperone GrpE